MKSVSSTLSNILPRSLVFVLALSTSFLSLWTQPTPKPLNLLDQLNSSLKELADRVSPAVVEVKVSGYGIDDDADENDDDARILVKQHLTGAGVILDPNGFIVTNAHL